LKKILQRGIRGGGAVLVAFLVAMNGLTVLAQETRPQIIPGERKPKSKKSTGPRAVGVLQMTANGKTSLVPIAILINGKFWDASAYKADPIPMALDTGNVYEAERTGNSLGLFTVGNALHRQNAAPGGQPPWIATGKWHPNGMESDTKTLKAEAAPVGLDTGNGPPRLTRDPAKKDQPPDSAPKKDTPSVPASDPASSKAPSGDEPPRLSKPASEPPAKETPKPDSSPSSDSKPGDGKASDSKPDDAKPKANVPVSDSGAGSGSRPVLRRGKPEESFADEDVPGYSKPGSKAASGDLSKAPPVTTQGDMELVPAISDASTGQLRSFVFNWLKGEEDDRRKQMTDLAKEQLRAYVAARVKSSMTATSARPGAARTGPKGKDPILENIRMAAYDLWGGNQPVIILSAVGHVPPPVGTPSETVSGLEYSVVVVAYPDIYNNLHKLYVGITDKFHLDLMPRLELIDAMDADGDGVGELLFRETSDQGTGWVIYRATADKLWKMFDSLRPE
jgi:hypothetical protein